MDELNNSGGINRRKFIETSVKLAGAAFIMGFGGANLIRASSTRLITNTIPSIVLNNGIKMPALGFGTLYLTNDLGVKCVSDAMSVGYRLIDTATIYGNEESVGEGIKKSGIQREELFITSKVWVDDSGYEKTKAAFNTSLKKLGLDYLDLYLIHRPRGDVKGSWKAMEELYKDGKIRAIGVSNFNGIQIEDLLASSKIIPAVNRIRLQSFNTHWSKTRPKIWKAQLDKPERRRRRGLTLFAYLNSATGPISVQQRIMRISKSQKV